MNFYRQRWLPVLLAGAALAVPWAPAAAVGGFQLPPGSDDQPKAQGPVDAGSTRPRVATPSPSPAPAPASTPAPTPAPSVAPVPVITPAAAPSVALPGAPAAAQTAVRPTDAAPVSSAVPTGQPTAVPGLNPLAQDRPPAAPGEYAAPQPAAAGGFTLPAWWPWAAGGIALLAIFGGLAVLLARRRKDRPDTPLLERPIVERPIVERPIVQPPVVPRSPATIPAAALPAPPPPPASTPTPEDEPDALSIAMEAREMTISLRAATLSYRITLTNLSQSALGGVAIAGDMVSAHASLALEDQIASADAQLAQKHEIERIRPGESVQVTGEFRLPFQAMHPIRQGAAALLVPLARLRIQAAQGGNGALIRTALVGQRAAQPGGRLQPFRLDLGPRIYREVTQKIF